MSRAPVQPKPAAGSAPLPRIEIWQALAVCGFLVLAVALVFGQTLGHGFASIDDFAYVYGEPHVTGGLSWSGLVWAFSSGPAGELYPLSMLTHMLDCQVYGLHPGGHHLTNLLLHAASSVMLFLLLRRMTEGLWPSALVAALFALHPLHVESVVWLAERRDVLSGLFFMLTLTAYGEYVRDPRSNKWYLALLACFTLGLLAKPMLVTLPPLLLLLDFWPLGRFCPAGPAAASPSLRAVAARRARRPVAGHWNLVREKLPLFALAFAAALATMLTHNTSPDPLTLPERLANAAVSCVAYLGQLFLPLGLSPFYSHPEAGRPAWQIAAALALLLVITAAAIVGRRSYPELFVGWFWYLGMLVPVLGLTYVGAHARADRYTYLSQIGLYIALAWGATRLGASWPGRRWLFGIGAAVMLAALMACSWRQTSYWHDGKTLWEHALACDPKNVTAHYALGRVLSETDETASVAEYRQALALGDNERSIYGIVRGNVENALGDLAAQKGNLAEAVTRYRQGLRWDSDSVASVAAHMNLAGLLARQGGLAEALRHFQRSLQLAPDNPNVYCNLAVVQAEQGQLDDAIANCQRALKVDANSGIAHSNLAVMLLRKNNVDEAIVHFRRAIDISPDVAFSYQQLAALLRQQGRLAEAGEIEERGKAVNRRFADAQNQRGNELVGQGQPAAAAAGFAAALAACPDDPQIHSNLAAALVLLGDREGAITHYRQALAIDPDCAPPDGDWISCCSHNARQMGARATGRACASVDEAAGGCQDESISPLAGFQARHGLRHHASNAR